MYENQVLTVDRSEIEKRLQSRDTEYDKLLHPEKYKEETRAKLTVFVGNIPFSATKEALEDLFARNVRVK